MYNASKLFRSTNYLTINGANGSDSHMMKNIEWGAVAYLKQSNYGLGITNIGENNNSNYITGCGSPAGSKQSSSCNAYNTTNGMQASTSGNITGVYDMSGGALENVMGNFYKTTGDSGLNVSVVPAEHIDIYSGNNESASHLGDALGETSGWYGDIASFVGSPSTWFNRGGYNFMNLDHIGIFNSYSSNGKGDNLYGFRVVLSVTE